MHHSGGAWTESCEIYGRLIAPVFQLEAPRFLSLGLGLGYNEMLIAEQARRHANSRWACVSYESDPFLAESLLLALRGEAPEGEIAETYESILNRFNDTASLRDNLLRAHQEKRWIIEGRLHLNCRVPFSIHGFLWDAFSQKTSPELWNEDFLFSFLQASADPDFAGLTTYACIGKLKRALKKLNFEVLEKSGFQGKRNSTLAWRGDWKPRQAKA